MSRLLGRPSEWITPRRPHWLTLTYATGAVLALAATPARADGLAGVFSPPVGLALTLGIAALEAPILARVVGGRRPFLVSLVANLLSAAAGLGLLVLLALSDATNPPPVLAALSHLSAAAQGAVALGVLFVMTLIVEAGVAYAFWRKQGVRRVALGVLVANVVSYAILIPLFLVTSR